MVADRDPGLRYGWMILLAHAGLLLGNALGLTGGVHRLSVVEHPIWFERDHYAAAMKLEEFVAIARLCLIAVSPYLCILFLRRDRRWPRLFVVSAASYLVAAMVLIWSYIMFGFWIFDTTFHFQWDVTGALIVAPALVLVVRSRELRSRFVREPAVLGPVMRMGIGLAAVLLISWPFTMTSHADSDQWISAILSPRESAAGIPLSWAMMASSFGGGVFVLLKFTWRMSNRWIALLLPLGYLSLTYAYTMMTFMMFFGR